MPNKLIRDSSEPKLDLLPLPQRIVPGEGFFRLLPKTSIEVSSRCPRDTLTPARQLADELEALCSFRPQLRRTSSDPRDGSLTLVVDEGGHPEGYRLTIEPRRVTVSGSGPAGVYYGVQTLRQIVKQQGPLLPCQTIIDEPIYTARGFYHDCTRGKVPKLETLFALVETMAHYKLNQLQLYIEHTFAFRRHADVWAGADPLSPEDILRLDEHCRRHHVELVPSFATFGHMYGFIRTWRKQHLNELDLSAMERPYSWRDRMGHYTLDVSNSDSLGLVEEIIEETSPLFSSGLFNICCDETVDLGKGRNRVAAEKSGTGRIYMDFLLAVMDAVRRQGKQPMFWGDIILQSPEHIPEIPTDAIALAWDYSANLTFGNPEAFAKAKVPFYVCPGVSGWSRWLNDVDRGWKNITRLAKLGAAHGAIGLLNTDWGDDGHVNLMAASFHGLLLGAAASWNVRTPDAATFDAAFSRLELGDPSGKAATLLWRLSHGSQANWRVLTSWLDPSPEISPDQRDPTTGALKRSLEIPMSDVLKAHRVILETRDELIETSRGAKPRDDFAYRELLCGAWGHALMHELLVVLQGVAGKRGPDHDLTLDRVADDLRHLESELSALWHLRNRPSEYHRIRAMLLKASERLDDLARPRS